MVFGWFARAFAVATVVDHQHIVMAPGKIFGVVAPPLKVIGIAVEVEHEPARGIFSRKKQGAELFAIRGREGELAKRLVKLECVVVGQGVALKNEAMLEGVEHQAGGQVEGKPEDQDSDRCFCCPIHFGTKIGGIMMAPICRCSSVAKEIIHTS